MNDSHPTQPAPPSPDNRYWADPFIDPTLAQQAASGPRQNMEQINQNLHALEHLQNELSDCESAGSPLRHSQLAAPHIEPAPGIQPRTPKPTVEIIGADQAPATEPDDVPVGGQDAGQIAPNEIELNFSVTYASQTETGSDQTISDFNTSQIESVPLDGIEFDGHEIHEFDLAMNVLPARLQQEEDTPVPRSARPPLNLDPVSNEFVFDVRDFSDCQASPHPIAAAYEVDPETFDHFTADQLNRDVAEMHAEAEFASVSPEDVSGTKPDSLESQNELFLAENDQVITLNGNDGFDLIDLSCFDSSLAVMEPGRIVISDPKSNTCFEVRHQNIPLVRFANEEIEI